MVPMGRPQGGALGTQESRGRGYRESSLMKEVRSTEQGGGIRVEASSYAGEGMMARLPSQEQAATGVTRGNDGQGVAPVRPIDYLPKKYQTIFNFPYFNEMQTALLSQVFETDVCLDFFYCTL